LTQKNPPRYRADLLLVLVCLVWGSTFVVVKDALANSSTLLFLTARFVLATFALALIFRRNVAGAFRPGPALAAGALTGAFLFLAYVLQTVGLRYTTPSKSAFLTGLSIVMVPVFAAVFERKRPGLSEAVGIAVATAGMALMTLRPGTLTMDKGDLVTVACAVAFAIQILLVGHFVPKFGFQAFTLVQVATAAALGAGSFWWIEKPEVRWTPGLIAAIAITGLVATAFAFSAQSWAQQHTTPTRTALILALEPVFAWGTSFVATGEVLSLRGALGAALILAGVLLVELPHRGQPEETLVPASIESRHTPPAL
jgi:drug/metabolite transporter (DMT)-like permease